MITGIPNLGMNYVNYRTSIQQKHHVELLGWPTDIPFANPHQITTVAIARKLQNVLSVATCKWVVMTKRQVKEHNLQLMQNIEEGVIVGKKRKERSDKGRKRKHSALADSDDEERDELEGAVEDDDDAPPPAKKTSKATAKSKTANKSKAANVAKKAQRIARTFPPAPPKSKAIIDSEDDETD
jgi:hypothetical protein